MILVTGASGLLGANLIMVALQEGLEVAGLYHTHPVHIPGAALYAADVTNKSAVERIFADLGPSSVIHCAAASNVDWCEAHPDAAREVNVTASAAIAKITAERNARLLYVSTDSVFDGRRGHYSEGDNPAPVNVYAQSKLQGEREVLRCHPFAAAARINFYGWNAQNKQSLAEWIVEQLAAGNGVPGFTDTIFNPILANDLAQILLAMVHRDLTGLYHVSGSEAVSKFEFARRVALTFGFDPAKIIPTEITKSKLKAPRPRNTSLNTGKICAALGVSMPDVDSGLRRFAQLRSEGYVERLKGHRHPAGVRP
jgi:dTDP-4-dehydrorhamnose reductase